ncbi:IS5/IS1182 family transposase, partial [Streptococcus sp. WM07]
EPIFGRMKGVFGVRRVHVRGNQNVETELGLLLMSMNLTKLTKRLVQYEKDKEKSQTNLYLLAKTKYKFSVIFQLLASFCPASFLVIISALNSSVLHL